MSLHIGSENPTAGLASSVNEIVIRLEEVSVRYRVPQERIGTFKEYMIRLLQRKISHRDFLALRDVSLGVRHGDVFGVVGPNGAGKSTLLKVVSRVLRPTNGRVWVKGRVAPLLELGAGFHPELTGRENVFLNGSLLGHSRREVEEKLDHIFSFADLGDFIHAPIRTYSTGMVARLGFAVATAWEPDILILDEVLAVGDEAFQMKCRARIDSFREHGSTVLLVSHNTEMIKDLCQQAIWLDQGMVRARGAPDEVVAKYHQG